ncbi:hypothetical protein Pint_17778 [Pistacia integerrima]|uniref:Uncharacterized protein n=1 Tax=Pistacia integerrima TaxID=434235 RepID=A0ACC0Z2U4_9ROSI|nr:hypothetical protein Pint_17778 [Pistacia integerrima]
MVTTCFVIRELGNKDALNVTTISANINEAPLTTNQLGLVIAPITSLPPRDTPRTNINFGISEPLVEFPLELLSNLRNELRDELLNLLNAQTTLGTTDESQQQARLCP